MAVIKRMVMIRRKTGTTHEQFRAYYEANHATMAMRLFPMFGTYKRNFIQPNAARLPAGVADNPYDVVTEMTFASDADYAAFMEKSSRPEVRAEVRADEAKFMDTDSIFSFIVEESVSK